MMENWRVGINPNKIVRFRKKKHIFGRSANADQHDVFGCLTSMDHTRQTWMCTSCFQVKRIRVKWNDNLLDNCPYCGKIFLKISWRVPVPKMNKRKKFLEKYLSTRPEVVERIRKFEEIEC